MNNFIPLSNFKHSIMNQAFAYQKMEENEILEKIQESEDYDLLLVELEKRDMTLRDLISIAKDCNSIQDFIMNFIQQDKD